MTLDQWAAQVAAHVADRGVDSSNCLSMRTAIIEAIKANWDTVPDRSALVMDSSMRQFKDLRASAIKCVEI